jgi:hypothetical protein
VERAALTSHDETSSLIPNQTPSAVTTRRPLTSVRRERIRRRERMIVCAVSTALLAAAIVAALLGSVERSTGGLLAVASLCGLGYGLLLAVKFQDDARRGSHLLWGVGLPMTALAIMLVVVSRNLSDPSWQGLALNLSATAIGVLITVFYLENVLRWHEQDRWARSETIILQELITETSLFRRKRAPHRRVRQDNGAGRQARRAAVFLEQERSSDATPLLLAGAPSGHARRTGE